MQILYKDWHCARGYPKRSEPVAASSRASHWVRLRYWHWNLANGFDDVDFIVLFGMIEPRHACKQMIPNELGCQSNLQFHRVW